LARDAGDVPLLHVSTCFVSGRRRGDVDESLAKPGQGGDAGPEELLAQLDAHCTQDRFIYRHRWLADDLVFWDNRCVMHQAQPYDQDKYVRHMHRTTVKGGRPF